MLSDAGGPGGPTPTGSRYQPAWTLHGPAAPGLAIPALLNGQKEDFLAASEGLNYSGIYHAPCRQSIASRHLCNSFIFSSSASIRAVRCVLVASVLVMII